MTEPFDDEQYYTAEQDFGGVEVTNFAKVLRSYSYDRYVRRFRAMADRHRLSPRQRPKLSASEFAQLMSQIRDALVRFGEKQFLEAPQVQCTAARLLVEGLFNVDSL